MFQLVPIALISGILTVFSPCVLPILPIVLASGIDGNKKRVKGIIVGLVLSFTIASLFLSAIISVFNISADFLRNLAAILLFLIGLVIVFPLWDKIQFYLEKFVKLPQANTKGGFRNGFLTGVGLGTAWTPCVGPIVATMATVTALNGFSIKSLILVLSYAVGIGLPLLLVADRGSNVLRKMKAFKLDPDKLRKIFGIVLILTSIFIFFGLEKRLQTWFVENLPDKWSNLATAFENRVNVNDKLKDEKAKKESRDMYYKIDPDEIVQGCLSGLDCIPSIDLPVFEDANTASEWLKDDDVVFAVNYNGIQKVYPQRILNWHEIVNDWYGQVPVAVTFCPLCGTGVSFIRIVNGETVEFGVSGKLHKSDLIMYDRTNEKNYWQQATGEAIAGEAAKRNEALTWVGTTTTTWEKWKRKYPETLVLSKDTGYSRDYDLYPYGQYEKSDELMFEVDKKDTTFHLKDVVLGIRISDEISKAYLLEDLREIINVGNSITDLVGDKMIKINRSEAEEYTFMDVESEKEIPYLRSFWFAWSAFNPNTEIYVK